MERARKIDLLRGGAKKKEENDRVAALEEGCFAAQPGMTVLAKSPKARDEKESFCDDGRDPPVEMGDEEGTRK